MVIFHGYVGLPEGKSKAPSLPRPALWAVLRCRALRAAALAPRGVSRSSRPPGGATAAPADASGAWPVISVGNSSAHGP